MEFGEAFFLQVPQYHYRSASAVSKPCIFGIRKFEGWYLYGRGKFRKLGKTRKKRKENMKDGFLRRDSVMPRKQSKFLNERVAVHLSYRRHSLKMNIIDLVQTLRSVLKLVWFTEM